MRKMREFRRRDEQSAPGKGLIRETNIRVLIDRSVASPFDGYKFGNETCIKPASRLKKRCIIRSAHHMIWYGT